MVRSKEMKEKRRALVTGCCGFIGSNLIHRLVKDGWVVEGVDDMSNGHQEFLSPLEVRSVTADMLHIYEHQEHPQPIDTGGLCPRANFG